MTASAKLKALEQKGLTYNIGYELLDALPQIVAVVEAAERVPELRYSNAQPSLTVAWTAKDLRAALAALDEALT